jgi:hypothetical protein
MSYLVANLPPIQCYIRKEYLYDFQTGFGEFEPCYWVSVKSIKGRALYIESLITNYGALYDKLPISAYVWKTNLKEDELLPLDFLEIWDAFSYNISIIEKSTLKKLDVMVYMKDKTLHKGEYLFTIDSAHSEPNELNVSLSETPNEHKSFNIIKLDNGQFTAQPNNRILFHDQSLTPNGLKIPDFKVSTKEFLCEKGNKWSVSDNNSFFYEFEKK